MSTESIFHPGELLIQSRQGVSGLAATRGRAMIRGDLDERSQSLFRSASFAAVGARDELGRPWATVLSGEPGFIDTPTARRLSLDAKLGDSDPLSRALAKVAEVALLAIDPENGRRVRANGFGERRRVGPNQGGVAPQPHFDVAVMQVFSNCQRFVELREIRIDQATTAHSHQVRSLTAPELSFLKESKFLFLTTGHGQSRTDGACGMDISHRGGPAGFVEIEDASHLSFPDFPGNALYSSIGNLIQDPRAGLAFIDESSGDIFHTTGEIRIVWSPRKQEDTESETRMNCQLVFECHEGVLRKNAVSSIRTQQ